MYLEPEQKAIAVMIAQGIGMSVKDLFMHGIETVGISRGYLKSDGSVKDEHKAEYETSLEMVKQSEVNS